MIFYFYIKNGHEKVILQSGTISLKLIDFELMQS